MEEAGISITLFHEIHDSGMIHIMILFKITWYCMKGFVEFLFQTKLNFQNECWWQMATFQPQGFM